MKKKFALLLTLVVALLALVVLLFSQYQTELQKRIAAESEAAEAVEQSTKANERLELMETYLANSCGYLSEEDLSDLNLFIEADQANKNDSGDASATKDTSYKKKYPSLYVKKTEEVGAGKKVVHLTFDDGPSYITPEVLDILDKYNIKATFFVVYNDDPKYSKYYKEIVKRGHTIAIHTASHDYKKVYASVDSYLEDFEKIYNYVYEETGVYPTLFRFPGGSTNCKTYEAGSDIIAEMNRRGFTYFDWNVTSGDGSVNCDYLSIQEKIIPNASVLQESVVLMHDSKGHEQTAIALPFVIDALIEKGCTFEPLTDSTSPVQFVTE